MLLTIIYTYAASALGISFIIGFGFALGVAIASRLLAVVTHHKVTYDNLDKPNHE